MMDDGCKTVGVCENRISMSTVDSFDKHQKSQLNWDGATNYTLTGCPVNKLTLLLTCSLAGQHASASVSISKEPHTPGLSNEGLGDPIRQFWGTLEPIF